MSIYYLPAILSACNFKDSLSNHTQVFLRCKFLVLQIVHKSSTSLLIDKYLTASIPSLTTATSEVFPPDKILPKILVLPSVTCSIPSVEISNRHTTSFLSKNDQYQLL